MSREYELLTDAQLDRLLGAASKPPELVGFEDKLAKRLANARPQANNVVHLFKPKAQPQPSRAYARGFGLASALAASLIIGVLIGNADDVGVYVEGLTGISSAAQVADLAPAGLDDLGIVDEGTQS